MKAWQTILLVLGGGLTVAYLSSGRVSSDVEKVQHYVNAPAANYERPETVIRERVITEPPTSPSKLEQMYEFVCNCNSTGYERDCPQCPDVRCPEVNCPTCQDCSSLDDLMEDLLQDPEKNKKDICLFIKRYGPELIEYLPPALKRKFGGEYLKGRFEAGYNTVADGIKSVLDKGSDALED